MYEDTLLDLSFLHSSLKAYALVLLTSTCCLWWEALVLKFQFAFKSTVVIFHLRVEFNSSFHSSGK